jgi:hypothetical protein
MPSPWRSKALRSDGQACQLLSGGVDTAQPLGKLVGTFGLGAFGQEAAGLPSPAGSVGTAIGWSPSDPLGP